MSSTQPYNEKDLFLQLAKGDHTAFTEIFYNYNKRLFPFVLKKVKDPSVAEELIQDIFLKLWTNRQHIGELENPEGYLFRIAANKTLDYFKHLASEQKMLSRQEVNNVSDHSTGHTELQLKEVETFVQQAISQLPTQRKIIYSLREDGLSYQQIADKLGISANTVKNQLIDASKFIRTYLIEKGISPLLFIHFCLFIKKVIIQ